MLLDDERYANVIEYGKDAVTKINEGNLKEGFEIADKGWRAFPESGDKWNQGYGYAKNFFKPFTQIEKSQQNFTNLLA